MEIINWEKAFTVYTLNNRPNPIIVWSFEKA